jgi:hypothetical protein
MTAGSLALDHIARTMCSVRPGGREVAMLALSAAVSACVASACPWLSEPQIRQVVDRLIEQVRDRLTLLDGAG